MSRLRDAVRVVRGFLAQITEVVGTFGRKAELVYYVGAAFEFVPLTTVPGYKVAIQARLWVEALGIVTIEAYPVIEWSEYLEAAA